MGTEPKNTKTFPVAALSAVLLVALITYGALAPRMGAYSDDLAIGYACAQGKALETFQWEVFHHHPRPTHFVALFGFHLLLYGRWAAMHFAQIAFFLVNVLLLAVLVWKWTKNSTATVAAAALFGLHPVISNFVFWPINIGNLPAIFFFNAALLALTEYFKRGNKSTFLWAWFFYLLACGSVEQTYAYFPAVAICGLVCGQKWRRSIVLAVPFFLVVVLYLAFQHLLGLGVGSRFGVEAGYGLGERILSTAARIGALMTVGAPEERYADLLVRGATIVRNAKGLFVLLAGAFGFLFYAFVRKPGGKGATKQGAPIAHPAWMFLLGLYLFAAGLMPFALRTDSGIEYRHFGNPVAGLAMALAAVVVWGEAALARRGAGASGRLARIVLLGGVFPFLCAASLVNLGVAQSFVDGWTYQKKVAGQIAACIRAPLQPNDSLYVENLRSHFGRVRTFADDWTLNNLLGTLHPQTFSQWNGSSLITLGVESRSPDALASTYAFVATPSGIQVRDRIVRERKGEVLGVIELPTAQNSSCPIAPALTIEVVDQRIQLAFGRELFMPRVHLEARKEGNLSSFALVYISGPNADPERFPLTIRLDFRDRQTDASLQTVSLPVKKPAPTFVGKNINLPFRQVQVSAVVRLSVLDRRGMPLTPLSPTPLVHVGPDGADLALSDLMR